MKRIYLTSEKILKKINLTLPEKYSLREYCPKPFDQGQEGSCTANALCHAYMLLCNINKNKDCNWIPSRSWVYFWEREEEQPKFTLELKDSGAYVIDGEKFAYKTGICSDSLMPYNLNIFPSDEAIKDSCNHKIKNYKAIDPSDIDKLISKNIPVLVALNIFDYFESDEVASNGKVRLPLETDKKLGGHEMLIIGYDKIKQEYLILNSWGENWGDKGFCYFPYSYIHNPSLSFAFSCIEL
jgi:C1A family cysteine protease